MTLAATLAKFRLSLEDLEKAARAEAARRRSGAKRFVERGFWKAEEVENRIAEMEAIADVLSALRIGQIYAEASQ